MIQSSEAIYRSGDTYQIPRAPSRAGWRVEGGWLECLSDGGIHCCVEDVEVEDDFAGVLEGSAQRERGREAPRVRRLESSIEGGNGSMEVLNYEIWNNGIWIYEFLPSLEGVNLITY